MIEVKNLVKTYSVKGGATVKALDNVSVTFPEKGMVFLLGRSGSGKSTLLNVAGGLDKPDEGEIIVKGKSSKNFSSSDFDSYRNTYVGFVFQEYNILNEFTVAQNIALALQLQNKKSNKAAVNSILEQVDLKGIGKRKPNTLSGGQKQRVAIARALIKEPEIIMADEPTGVLDSATGRQVLDTLKKLSKDKLVIIVSHDREFAEYYGDRIIELKDGKIISDTVKKTTVPKALSDNVQFLSRDTVRIKDVEGVTDTEINKIFKILKKTGGETIISSNGKEVSDIKRVCKINEDGSKDSFEDTQKVEVKKYDGKKVKFIKSHMPLVRSIKMGASGMKTKPIRLAFTIFLSVISFVMFGVVSTFMLYDSAYSVSVALRDAQYPSIVAQGVCNYESQYVEVNLLTKDSEKKNEKISQNNVSIRLSEEQVEKLNNNSANLKFAGIFTLSQEFPMGNFSGKSDDYYSVTSFTGFSDCGEEYLKQNGFTLSSGKYPTADDEIAVSTYVDELYVKYENSSVLGKVITSGDYSFKVVGVYNTEGIPSKYDVLKNSATQSANRNELKTLLNNLIENSFHSVAFVSSEFYEKNVKTQSQGFFNGQNLWAFNIWCYNKLNDGFSQINKAFTDRMVRYNQSYFKFYDLNGKEDTRANKEKLSLSQNEIYVPLSSKDSIKTWKVGNNIEGQQALTVKGYYEIVGEEHDEPVLSDELLKANGMDYYSFAIFNNVYKQSGAEKYDGVISVSDNSEKSIKALRAGGDSKNNYNIEISSGNYIYGSLLMFVTVIEYFKKIFLIVGAVIAAFSSLLLLNFISISISAKKKEIGILRAIGARGWDVFKIFFTEALLISLICVIISSVGSWWACGLFNQKIINFSFMTTAAMLNFNIINVGIIAAISIGISFIATFFPVLKAAKKPPVDSIRTI